MNSFFDKLNKNSKYLFIQLFLLFVLTNLLISDFNCRKDISRENRFNLTDSTEKILSNLKDKLIIDAFYSTDVPGVHKARLNLVKELLREMASKNRKMVDLRFIDPDSGESDKRKADEAGIRSYPLEKLERGSAEVKQAYFGIRMTLGTKTESIPLAYNAETLEYQVLTLLKKMTKKSNQSSLAILKAPGAFTYPEPGPMSGKETFGVFIHKIYSPEFGEPSEININQEKVPEEYTTLLWVGSPKLDEKGKFHIDQFLMRGGSLIVLGETMKFQLPNPRGMQADFGMNDGMAQSIEEAEKIRNFTKFYGFEIKSEMILEPERALPTDSFIQMEGGFLVRYHYPLWPVATGDTDGLSKDSLITKHSSGIILPWVSGIDIHIDKQPEAKILPVILTSKDADRKENYIPIGENQVANLPINPAGINIPMGVHIEGKLISAFNPESIPEGVDKIGFMEKTQNDKKSQILVLGTPYLLSDIFFSKQSYMEDFQKTNMPFFLNLLDIFSGDTDLLSTRTKQAYIKNLKPIAKWEQYILSTINILFIPIFIGLYAFIRINKRFKSN
jgi:ABC-type uncharacterized transport system involved in gliding motility auxiliary subunit